MTDDHPLTVSRNRAGLSQEALAERVGCRRWMINRIEAGERSPSMQLLAKLVRETGVSADAVLNWNDRRETAA